MNQSVPRFTLPFLVLTVLFCVCLIVSNLIEIKTVDIGFATITAGMVVFPLSYIINDCIVEVYGFRKARTVIWLGFAMNLLVTLFLQFAILLPGADSWQSQDAMEAVYGTVPRILGASFVAFLCGSMVNALVMSKMKVASGGRHFSLRAIVSTLWGEGTPPRVGYATVVGVGRLDALKLFHHLQRYGQYNNLIGGLQQRLSHDKRHDFPPRQNTAKCEREKYYRVGAFAPKSADDGSQ